MAAGLVMRVSGLFDEKLVDNIYISLVIYGEQYVAVNHKTPLLFSRHFVGHQIGKPCDLNGLCWRPKDSLMNLFSGKLKLALVCLDDVDHQIIVAVN
jgi:hypothetical protein